MTYDICCRICLVSKSEEYEIFKNIFTSTESFNNKILKLIDAIVECAPIQIEENDNLPKNICLNCLEKLQTSYEFRQLCLQSDIKLKISLEKQEKDFNNDTKSIKVEPEIIEEIHLADDDIKNETKSNNNEKISCHLSTYIKSENDVGGGDTAVTINTNKIRKLFKCMACNKGFTTIRMLTNHIRIHTGERPFGCDICDKRFKQKVHLSVHKRTHAGEKNNSSVAATVIHLKCSLCDETFNRENEIEKHYSEIHLSTYVKKEKDLSCRDTLVTTNKNKIRKLFKCMECNKSFKTNRMLTIHLRIHTGERPFVCDICDKRFRQKVHLSVHKWTHTGEKNNSSTVATVGLYQCSLCDETFKTSINLKRHLIKHKQKLPGENRSPFTCNSCGKGFISKPELSEHLLIHAGEYEFMCDICGYVFEQSSYLKKHMLTHTGVKAFSCTICSKEFTNQSFLQLHSAAHDDELPHKCGLCPKRFKWRVGLWRHEKQHSGEKPYKCNVCSKGFIEAGALRSHLRVHTGERPYKCDICFKTFKVTSTLTTHKKIHLK